MVRVPSGRDEVDSFHSGGLDGKHSDPRYASKANLLEEAFVFAVPTQALHLDGGHLVDDGEDGREHLFVLLAVDDGAELVNERKIADGK